MKIYTKTGDDGSTGLPGRRRARKDDPLVEALGALDELCAAIGVASTHLTDAGHKVRGWLTAVQSDLFTIGALLASPDEKPAAAAALNQRTAALEADIDQMEKGLPELTRFILPQGTPAASFLHLARGIARRAERRVVALSLSRKSSPPILAYLNRLSDFLFVLARWANRQEGGLETAWTPPAGLESATPAAGQQDRLQATLQKLEEQKENRKTLFEKASVDAQKKREMAEKLFKQNVEQIRREGGKVEKPENPFDLD